jgi:Phage tail tube protein, TTP
MATVKGRGVRVELGATYGSAIPVSAVTLANPGVATSTAHGQADATVGYFDSVTGMVQLNGQGVRIDAPTTNNFTLQGLNTTQFPAYTAGNFFPVLTWSTLAEATSYAIGGGDAAKLDTTTLIDVIQQQENGLLAPQTLSLNVIAQTVPSAAMQLVQAAAQAGTKLVVRITHPDGSVRVCYGEPSFPGEDVQQGAVGTGSLTFSVKGFVLALPA